MAAVDSARSNAASNLWVKAHGLLSDEDRARLTSLHPGKLEILQEVLELVTQKRDESMRKRWKFRRASGEHIIMRDVFTKIARWIDKFKEVGDMAMQYDPVHAALPWAGLRIVLQALTSDIDMFDAMIEGVAHVTGLITRYAIFECIYLQGEYRAKQDLETAMVRLYEAILTFLLKAEQYYTQKSLKRALESIGQNSANGIEHLLNAIDEHEQRVGRCSDLIRQEGQLQVSDAVQKLDDLLHSLQEPILRIAHQVSDLHDDLTKNDRKLLLLWLSKVPYRQHHKANFKDVLPNSGQWLLSNTGFREWMHSNHSSLLWLHGIPGCGKTKCMSIVVQSLLNLSKSTPGSAPLAYFYCVRDPAELDRANPDEIANALLKQLTCKTIDEPVSPLISHEYETRSYYAEMDGLEAERLELTDCTRLMLEHFDREPGILLIDALDECDIQRRHELFHMFFELLEKANNVVKIFVTGREDIDINREFSKFTNIRIAAKDNSEDIARFVAHQLDLVIQKRILLQGNVSSKLKQHITQTLINGAQGMFRWVSLQLQQLSDPSRMKTEEDVEDALNHLPQTLAELYAIIYKRIVTSAPNSRILAQSIISWLLCAQRPLSSAQLIYGASTHLKQLPTSEQILDVCCNLVVLDAESDTFRFAHLSVREFFELQPDFDVVTTNAFAAKCCLELLVQQLGPKCVTHKPANESRIFSKYAILYWPSHYEMIEPGHRAEHFGEMMQEFFAKSVILNTSPFEKWLELSHTYSKQLESSDNVRIKLDWIYARPPVPVFLLAAYGLLEVVSHITGFSEAEWSRRNSCGQLPVHLVAACGQIDFLRILCEKDSKWCNERDNQARTPIFYGSMNGHTDIVRHLAALGASVDGKDSTGRTPLSYAAQKGHSKICRFLLEHGAIVDSRSERDLRTPLCYAARNGYTETVQLLHSHGADIEASESEGYTPLSWAADAGMTDTVGYLLDQGAQIDKEDSYGQTALSRAAAIGREATVKLLLERDADPYQRDKCGHTPLSRAAWLGMTGTGAILLERRVPIDTQDDEGKTPMIWAAQNGHAAMVKLLLEAGADDEIIDFEGRTALWWATQNDHDRIELMLSRARTARGQSMPLPTTLSPTNPYPDVSSLSLG